MATPRTLLPWLLGAAVGIGGVFHGLHWRSTSTSSELAEIQGQLRDATGRLEILERENESLRSLAQGGGEVAIPNELIDRVEKDFALRFLSSPVVHRLAAGELQDRIAAAIESRLGPSGIDDRQEAYRLIGWLGPDDDLLALLASVKSVGAKGWFDDVTGEAWVTDRFELANIPDQAAMVRLLGRILLHQHFPPPPGYAGDDAARARDSLHHGAASGAEARYYAANARAIGFLPIKQNDEAEQLLVRLPSFIQGLVTFPTSEGRALADRLFHEGPDKLLEALRDPPQSTRSIYFPGERVKAPALTLPKPPEEPYLTESAGQLGLRLWLERGDDIGMASELAAAWRADQYLLFPDGEASAALLWDIEFSSPGAADLFQEKALSLFAAIGDLGEPLEIGKHGITSNKRFLEVSRPGSTRIRLMNTVTPETLRVGKTNS